VPWAAQYVQGFDAWLSAVRDGRVSQPELLPPGPIVQWDDTALEALPPPAKLPKRFVSSARSSVLKLTVRGTRWLVVTDATEDSLREAIEKTQGPFDAAVLPTLPGRSSYDRILDQAMHKAQPRVVILCGSKPPAFDATKWAKEHLLDALFVCATDGAVTGEPRGADGLLLRSFATGREVRIAPSRR
jgi:hypothetical protein